MDGKLYYGNEYKMSFDRSEKRKIYNKNVASAYTTEVMPLIEWDEPNGEGCIVYR